ncbi:MAG: hypothetical protein Q8L02_03650 [Candidatus Nitrotoga sp.]|nr:hypothetical protein [Candidatus Nitrotoga sp.]
MDTILFVLQWRTAALIAGTKNTGVTYQTATGDVKIVDEFIGTRETSSPVKLRSMGDDVFLGEFEHRHSAVAKSIVQT